eukprot:418205-Pleurochrysis_carterae.AAC.1
MHAGLTHSSWTQSYCNRTWVVLGRGSLFSRNQQALAMRTPVEDFARRALACSKKASTSLQISSSSANFECACAPP